MSELRLEGISVSYGPSPALRGLDLTIGPGEIVSLLGGNASGKSTTMKTVLGLKRPDAGRIIWDGEEIQSWPTARRVRAGIASVPEARRVFPDMSVEDNLLVGAHTRRDREIRATLAEVHDAFPRLRERRAQRAGTLSGGEQQMLALSRALIRQPRLLMLDEPSMGLAPKIVAQMFEIISEINAAGTSVLLIEQNARMALSIAHRGYLMETATLSGGGDARVMLEDERLHEAYFGKSSESRDE